MNLKDLKRQREALQQTVKAYQAKIDKARSMRNKFEVELELCEQAILDNIGFEVSPRFDGIGNTPTYDAHDDKGKDLPDKHGQHTVMFTREAAVERALANSSEFKAA